MHILYRRKKSIGIDVCLSGLSSHYRISETETTINTPKYLKKPRTEVQKKRQEKTREKCLFAHDEIITIKSMRPCVYGKHFGLCAESEHNYGKHQPQQQQLLPVPPQQSLVFDGVRRRSKLHYVVESGCARWVCDVCGRTYNRGDSLAHHRSIHRGDTICPICQTVFTRKYTMRCHMVNVHGVK